MYYYLFISLRNCPVSKLSCYYFYIFYSIIVSNNNRIINHTCVILGRMVLQFLSLNIYYLLIFINSGHKVYIKRRAIQSNYTVKRERVINNDGAKIDVRALAEYRCARIFAAVKEDHLFFFIRQRVRAIFRFSSSVSSIKAHINQLWNYDCANCDR